LKSNEERFLKNNHTILIGEVFISDDRQNT